MQPILLGTGVNVAGEFRNSAGNLFDPPTVLFKIHEPDGTETVYTYGVDVVVVRTATGKYSMWNRPEQAGVHVSRLVSSGASADDIASEQSFVVIGSAFTSP